MYAKGTLLKNALFIIICAFFLILALSSFRNLKKMELEFNEKKATLVKENLDLKDRINAVQETLSQKTDALNILEADKKVVQEELGILRKENDRIMASYGAEIEALKRKSAALRKRLSNIEKTPVVTTIRQAMDRENNENIKKVLALAAENIELIKSGKAVSLEPIVVTGLSGQAAPSGVATAVEQGEKQGMVLSADAKNNLIVIDMGRRDDIKEGDLFKIFKETEEIAEAEIISARYRIAAAFICDIQPRYTIDDVKEGSRAVLIRR